MDRQEQINTIVKATDVNDSYFSVVGPVVSDILDQGGEKALKEFCDEVSEHRGKRISFGTMQKYGYFWKRLQRLNLPMNAEGEFEFTTQTLLKIARIKGESIRRRFVNKIIKEGLNEDDVAFLLKYR